MRKINISEFKKNFDEEVKNLPALVLKNGEPFIKLLPIEEDNKCEFDDKWLGVCGFEQTNFYKITWLDKDSQPSKVKHQWLCPKHVREAGEEIGVRIVEI